MPAAAENRDNRLERLLKPLVTPAVFDFWAGRLRPGLSWERPLARVVARHEEARDAVTLELQPNRHFHGFRPGQHINVTAEVDGSRVTRSYSLTGIPATGGRIGITVRRVGGGRLSNQLCDHCQPGDVLEIGQAFGELALPATGEPLLFLAAGSGITPLMSLTRAMAADGMPVPLTLIYWAGTRAELCFARELQALAAREPAFTLHLVLTREAVRPIGAESGRISAGQLQALVPDLARRHVVGCGPAGFIASARELAGGTAASFQAEAFTPPAPLATDDAAVRDVRVTLQASGRTLTVSTGDSLLEALEAQGLRPAHGCRMGICNSCACAKLDGVSQDLHSGEQNADPVSALRLCVSRARGDITLDL